MAPPLDAPRHPRRFYQTVTVVAETAGYGVNLDARALHTPAKARFLAPTAALAEMIAEEWRGQETQVRMESMAATRLAYTALDRIGAAREAVAADIARTAGADHLCYFAPAPQSLVERQTRLWGPVLDWARDDLGLEFVRVSGVTHQAQPPETLARVEALAAELNDFALAALALATGLFGSAILAWALQRERLDAAAAFDLSRLDEAFQESQWGIDAEAAQRTEAMRLEAAMLGRWFRALR